MTTTYNEYRTVEKEILDHLRTPALGWRYEHGEQVTKKYRNGAEDEVLLLPILRQKLKQLNPGVITTDERADRILTHLRTLRDNQEWLAWLRNEKTFQFAVEENAQPVRLIDYDHNDNNDFLVTNQLWVQGNERRP